MPLIKASGFDPIHFGVDYRYQLP